MAQILGDLDSHEACHECKDLFQKPSHLKAFFPSDGMPETVQWQRGLEKLSTGARDCRLCHLLVRWFKLDTTFWANCSLLRGNAVNLVFAATMADMQTSHMLIIYLEGLEDVQIDANSNWLSLDLLADAGMIGIGFDEPDADRF